MKKDGVSPPASIDKMRASGAKSFLHPDGRVFDLLAGEYTQAARSTRATATLTVLRKGAAPVLKNDGAEAWDLGDGVLGLTFKTRPTASTPTSSR
jgi:3-hydroxyacyl-CoA dehydrogenase